MNWLKKLLEGKGLSEEQINEIVGGVEQNYKGYVPEYRFNEVNDAKKQLESDLKERDKQLNELKKNAGDNEELKKQIEQLQKDNKLKDEEYQNKVKELSMNTALKLALSGEVHDIDLTISQLDKAKIELNDDGTVKGGLEEQVKSLRESKAFLFVQKDPNNPTFRGINPAEGTDPSKNTSSSIGESFAKNANESSKSSENNFWS